VPCRCRVEGQEAFASSYVISTQTALDFSVHSQVSNRDVKGIEFALILEYCPESLLTSIIAILDACLSGGSSVRAQIQHLQTFDVQAVPLTQGGRLYTFESRSGGIARIVRLRFISTGPGGS
jgi:hypothetical protein